MAEELADARFELTLTPPFGEELRDTFGRVTVVLGTNGAGKSRMLRRLAENPVVDDVRRDPLFVEGLRQTRRALSGIALQGRLPPRPEGAAHNLNELRVQQRVIELLSTIAGEDGIAHLKYLEQLRQWDALERAGVKGRARPGFPQLKLFRLGEAYSAVLPHLRLVSPEPGEWMCYRGETSYPLTSLSDGEAEVFLFLADTFLLPPDLELLVIVDEPELHLHPGLAAALWDNVERRLPRALFVYATHSVQFAMRTGVTDIVVLDRESAKPLHLPSVDAIPSKEFAPFLGAAAAIMRAGRVVYVEGDTGDDRSVDRTLYRWLAGDPGITISSVGSCEDVRAAVKHEGVWERLGDVSSLGIVDRDYRSDDDLLRYREAGCHVLKWHEAESLLLHPDLLYRYARAAGSTASRESIEDALYELAAEHTLTTAINRTIAATRMSVSPSLPRDGRPKTADDAIAALRSCGMCESLKVQDLPDQAEATFRTEWGRCAQAIANRDLEAVLTLFPGKEILRAMRARVGAQSAGAILRATVDATKPEEFPHLLEVQKAIRSALAG